MKFIIVTEKYVDGDANHGKETMADVFDNLKGAMKWYGGCMYDFEITQTLYKCEELKKRIIME